MKKFKMFMAYLEIVIFVYIAGAMIYLFLDLIS